MKKVLITEICDILVGRTPSRYNPDYWGTGFPWLSIADMNQGELLSTTKETITAEAVKECNCKQIPKGTVLFSFKLSIGKVGITDVDMFTNEAIAAFLIKDKSRLDTKFLFYTLKSTDYSVGSNKAVMGKTLNKEQLKKFTIPLPPIEEQHRIVKILDQAQSLIEKRKQAIAYLDDYIKAVFLDMFGDPVSNPKGWAVKNLKEVCTKIADGTHYSPPLVENGIPYITARHLKPKGLDFFRNPTYISREEHDKIYSRCTPEKGDVLYIKDGATTGIAAINSYDFEFSMLSSLALLKPNSEFIRNHYLCYWLNNPKVKSNLLQQMAGVAIQRFTLTKINNFLVPTPPLELQDNFSKIFERTNPIQLQMQTQLKELEDNFQAQLQRAFRGY